MDWNFQLCFQRYYILFSVCSNVLIPAKNKTNSCLNTVFWGHFHAHLPSLISERKKKLDQEPANLESNNRTLLFTQTGN